MPRRLASLALGLMLLPAAAAGAHTRIGSEPDVRSGPALAGGRVVVAVPAAAGAQSVRIEALQAGEKPRSLEVLPTGPGYPQIAVGLDASASRLAAAVAGATFSQDGRSVASRILLGPLDGPFTEAISCAGIDLIPPTPAVSGDVVAYAAPGCSGDIVVHDGSPAGAPDLRLPAGGAVQALAVNDRYVAWVTGEEGIVVRLQRLVVFDRQRGVPVRVATLDDIVGPGGFRASEASLAVGDDGSAFVVVTPDILGSGCSSRIVRYAPGAGDRFDLGLGVCRTQLRYAGGRLVAALPSGGQGVRLALIDPADGRASTVVPFAGQQQLNGFDFDGARVAWNQRGCLSNAQYTSDMTDAIAHPVAGTSCTPKLLTGRLVSRGGRVRVRVSCPHGCHGMAGIAGPLWLNYSKAPLGLVRFRLRPGQSKAIALRLPDAALARVRRAHRLRVRVKLWADPGFITKVERTLVAR